MRPTPRKLARFLRDRDYRHYVVTTQINRYLKRRGKRARLRSHVLFLLFHLQWHGLRLAYRCLPENSTLGKGLLERWKRSNESLNEHEATARKEKLCSLPPYLTFETTMKCNLRCPMCFRQHVEDTPEQINRLPDMSPKMLQQLAHQLFPTALTVNITLGGEPFMARHLELIFELVERYDVKLDVVTNATLLHTRDLLPRLVKLLASIEVSLDSTIAEQFEKIRYPANFERVMTNTWELARLRLQMPEPRFRFGLSFSAMRKNIHELPQIVRLIAELGGTHVRVTPLLVHEEKDQMDSLVFAPELYNEVLAEAQAAADEAGVDLYAPAAFMLDANAGRPPVGICHDVYRSTFINFDGVVRTCCQVNPPIAGDIKKENFRAVWNGAFYRRIRRTYDTPEAIGACRNCFIINRGPGTVEDRRQQEFTYLLKDKGKAPSS